MLPQGDKGSQESAPARWRVIWRVMPAGKILNDAVDPEDLQMVSLRLRTNRARNNAQLARGVDREARVLKVEGEIAQVHNTNTP
jgi:hypothetical protein